MIKDFVKEIILNKRVKIVDIIIAKVKIYDSPFRCSWRNKTLYYPDKKKIRGNKFGYMVYVKYEHDNFNDSTHSFGYRVYTKKAALKIAKQTEAYIISTYNNMFKYAGGHHLQNLLDIVHSKLYHHNVFGEKNYTSHHKAQGNKDFFPTFYMLKEELKEIIGHEM